jgi:hypothetical protein
MESQFGPGETEEGRWRVLPGLGAKARARVVSRACPRGRTHPVVTAGEQHPLLLAGRPGPELRLQSLESLREGGALEAELDQSLMNPCLQPGALFVQLTQQ